MRNLTENFECIYFQLLVDVATNKIATSWNSHKAARSSKQISPLLIVFHNKIIRLSHLCHSFLQKFFEELKLWNVAAGKTPQHVKEQLNLSGMIPVKTMPIVREIRTENNLVTLPRTVANSPKAISATPISQMLLQHCHYRKLSIQMFWITGSTDRELYESAWMATVRCL